LRWFTAELLLYASVFKHRQPLILEIHYKNRENISVHVNVSYSERRYNMPEQQKDKTREQLQVEEIEKSLRLIADIVKQKGREILNEFPITPPQFVALQWLHEYGDMTIGELSSKMYLACSTTTDLVDRMEKNDLVERVKDTNDRRVVRIHLLSKGATIIREVIKQRQIYLQDVLGDFSKEDVDFLEKSLSFLYDEMKRDAKTWKSF
jgi:DNA-binding MarR family transcriptional regulator